MKIPRQEVDKRGKSLHSPHLYVRFYMMKEEGLAAFYRSCRMIIVMNIPSTAVHFLAYEVGKKVCFCCGW